MPGKWMKNAGDQPRRDEAEFATWKENEKDEDEDSERYEE